MQTKVTNMLREMKKKEERINIQKFQEVDGDLYT